MQGEGHRDIGLFGKFLQHRPGVAGNHAVAAEHDRPLAAVDHLDGLVQDVPLR